ncbi:MAG: hypothetical protein ACLSWY_04675 [Ruthenibacterium lactatiformans]
MAEQSFSRMPRYGWAAGRRVAHTCAASVGLAPRGRSTRHRQVQRAGHCHAYASRHAHAVVKPITLHHRRAWLPHPTVQCAGRTSL